MKRLLLSILLFLIAGSYWAQISVTPGVSASALISGFASNGITISNVTVNCPSNAYGTFSNGSSTNIGLNSGVILTTGNAAGVVGPNSSGSYGNCNGTSYSDPQLTALQPVANNDPCIIEFDMVAQCNQMAVRFVFGSEEYPEFVGASYNDAFGFFVSGPGPACQASYYNNTNIATLPDNVTPVSIDNVNGSTNSSYYINNIGGATIQYDGFTTVLTRTLSVCPCQTYHFKIAIADAGDCYYDSGVLINFIQCSQPGINASITSTATICGSSIGSASATVSGGTGPYTYTWSPAPGSGQGTSTVTGLSAGVYTLSVNDALACSSVYTTTVSIGSMASSTVAINSNSITCFGFSNGTATAVVTGGTGPYTYTWSPSGGNTVTASGLNVGSYTVNITDANGCAATGTTSISQPVAWNATDTQTNLVCPGATNGAINATVTGGTAPYSYTWSPFGGNTSAATGLSAGNYTLSVKDANSCSASFVLVLLGPTPFSSVNTQTNVPCNGGTGTANISLSGGTPGYTYTWSPYGGNGTTATGLLPGNYTLAATDAQGCGFSRVFNITQPAVLSGTGTQTNVACHGTNSGFAKITATGGTTPYSYTWTPSGGNAATSAGLTAGNYTVTVVDAHQCSFTNTYTITEPTTFSIQSAGFTSVICAGQSTGSASVTVNGGNPAYTYTWQPSGGNGTVATGLGAGNYSLFAKDANGCQITTVITIVQPTAILSTISQTNVLCNGSLTGVASVSASAGTGPYTYTWLPSGGNGTIATGLGANLYTVTIRDANLCILTRTINITQPPALATVSSQTNVSCHGGSDAIASVIVSGGVSPYTYTWTPLGGSTSSATGLAAGNYTLSVLDNNLCPISRSLTITEPPVLVSAIAANSITCFGFNNGSSTVTTSGGTTPYTYSWSPAAGSSSVISSLSPGSYSVLVKDAHGCTNSLTVSIVQPPVLSSTKATTSVSCYGYTDATATVFATGGVGAYTYSWNPTGATTSVVTSIGVGTYTATVKDGNQCTSTSTMTVIGPTQYVMVILTNSVLCHGQSSGSATLTVSGNTPLYTYTWSPSGGNGLVAPNLSAGNYTLSMLDAHQCPATRTLNIPEPAALTISVSSSPANCGNADGSSTVTVNGGNTPYSYSWTPTGYVGGPVLSAVHGGQYTCTVHDANNCQISASTGITTIYPSVTLSSGNVSVCPGVTTSVSATGSNSYTWTPSTSAPAVTGSLVSLTPSITTIYTVTGANLYGCTAAQTLEIRVYAQPVVALSVASPTLCAGSTTSLIATGAASYTWSPATGLSNTQIDNPTTTLQNSVTYSVNGLSSDGCSASATIAVTVEQLPTVSITTAGSTSVCMHTSAILVAHGADTYSWSTGLTDTQIAVFPTAETTYTLTGTSASGCASGNSATISISVNASPTVDISTSNTVICQGGVVTLTASGAGTYNWNTGASGAVLTDTPTADKFYSVIGIDANGCKDTATFNVTVYTNSVVSIAGRHEVCKGEPLTLTANGGTNYSWSTGDHSTAITYSYDTNTLVTVNVGSVLCSSGSYSFAITVNALPTLTLTGDSTAVHLGQHTALTLTTNATQISWLPTTGLSCNTCSTPVVQPSVSTVYTVQATNAKGCKTTGTVSIIVDGACGELFGPNAFSPNNDNNNDTWCIYGNCIKTLTCEIFNRWGQKVFSMTDKGQCWDGTVNGTMQDPGVFIYQAKVELINGDSKTLKGNFILLR